MVLSATVVRLVGAVPDGPFLLQLEMARGLLTPRQGFFLKFKMFYPASGTRFDDSGLLRCDSVTVLVASDSLKDLGTFGGTGHGVILD
jgi:hypothetical protein